MRSWIALAVGFLGMWVACALLNVADAATTYHWRYTGALSALTYDFTTTDASAAAVASASEAVCNADMVANFGTGASWCGDSWGTPDSLFSSGCSGSLASAPLDGSTFWVHYSPLGCEYTVKWLSTDEDRPPPAEGPDWANPVGSTDSRDIIILVGACGCFCLGWIGGKR